MSEIRANTLKGEDGKASVDFPGGITGVAATFTGSVSVGGTLTYEDVTNIDSTGIVTARSGLKVGPAAGVGATIDQFGNCDFAGITTTASFRPRGQIGEKVKITAGKLSDNLTINIDNGMVHHFTTQETTTAIPNIISTAGINTEYAIGDQFTVSILTTAAAGGYSAQWQVDGAAVTEQWGGGNAPSAGGADGYDLYTVNIIKTASETFTVLASVTNFT
jgi:hypothetical protein